MSKEESMKCFVTLARRICQHLVVAKKMRFEIFWCLWVQIWVRLTREGGNIYSILMVRRRVRVFLTAPIGCIVGCQKSPQRRSQSQIQLPKTFPGNSPDCNLCQKFTGVNVGVIMATYVLNLL